ncbi:MAG: hypothetical protein FVQ83_11580 [Chloroflexi bacterium]|nr:hypothetical protein [Chloroflexota bacterium]
MKYFIRSLFVLSILILTACGASKTEISATQTDQPPIPTLAPSPTSPPSATMIVILPTASSTSVATIPTALAPTSTPTLSPYYFEVEDRRILNIYQSADDQLLISVDLFGYYDEMPPIAPDNATIINPFIDSVWSPQGRYLAFMGAIDGPSSDLYLFDTLTLEIRRLSSGPNQATSPFWSLDGEWIVHDELITAVGGQIQAVWAAKVDGSELIRLYDPQGVPDLLGFISPTTYYVFDKNLGGRVILRLVNLDQNSVVNIYDFSAAGGDSLAHAFDPESGAIVFYPTVALEYQIYGDNPGFYLAAPWELTPTLIVPSHQAYSATVFWDKDQGVFITSEPCPEQAGNVQAFTIEGTVSCVEPPP